MKQFFNELMSEWKKVLIGLITVFVVSKWEAIMTTFSTGAETERIEEFKADMKVALKDTAVLNSVFEDPVFVATFFAHPTVDKKVKELGIELHKKVVHQIIQKDSTKVSTRDYISAEINMHPDSVLPFQAKFWRMVREGKMATKTDVKEIAKETAKAVVGRRRSPEASL